MFLEGFLASSSYRYAWDEQRRLQMGRVWPRVERWYISRSMRVEDGLRGRLELIIRFCRWFYHDLDLRICYVVY